ncbi:unnamed protein product, partial [Mesorhabditis spiculigera]
MIAVSKLNLATKYWLADLKSSKLLPPFSSGWLINNGPHADKSAIGMLLMANVFLDQSKDVHNFDVKGNLKRCVLQDEKKAAKPTERDREFKDQYRKDERDKVWGSTQHEGVTKAVEVKMRLVDILLVDVAKAADCKHQFLLGIISIANIATDCGDRNTKCRKATVITNLYHLTSRHGWAVEQQEQEQGPEEQQERRGEPDEHDLEEHYHLRFLASHKIADHSILGDVKHGDDDAPLDPRNTLRGTIQRGDAIESVVVKMKFVDVLLLVRGRCCFLRKFLLDAANVVSRKHEFLLGVADFVFPDPNWRVGYRQRMEIQDKAGRMNIKGRGSTSSKRSAKSQKSN